MVFSLYRPYAALTAVWIFLSGAAFGAPPAAGSLAAAPAAEPFVVYKSPTCGCCAAWLDHLNVRGIATRVEHPADLNAIKDRYGIAPRHQSCHTAVSPDGYVFEGHIPANVMQRFLREKPAGAQGLAVPGMPLGSPGMEVDDRFSPYDIYLLKRDGSTEVYTRINSPADQKEGT